MKVYEVSTSFRGVPSIKECECQRTSESSVFFAGGRVARESAYREFFDDYYSAFAKSIEIAKHEISRSESNIESLKNTIRLNKDFIEKMETENGKE